jgi:hypothetical protein
VQNLGQLGGVAGNGSYVLHTLLQKAKPLTTEQPEEILLFFARIGQIHELGLVEDRVFHTPLALASSFHVSIFGRMFA